MYWGSQAGIDFDGQLEKTPKVHQHYIDRDNEPGRQMWEMNHNLRSLGNYSAGDKNNGSKSDSIVSNRDGVNFCSFVDQSSANDHPQ